MHHMTIGTAPKSQVELPLKPAQIREGIVLAVVEHTPDRVDADLGQRVIGINHMQGQCQVQDEHHQANPRGLAQDPSNAGRGGLLQAHDPDVLPECEHWQAQLRKCLPPQPRRRASFALQVPGRQ